MIAPHDSYRTAPFLAAAKAHGIEVLIASEAKHSLVSAYVDGLHLDLGDIQASLQTILREAHRRPFAAVLGSDDASTEIAALAATELGLPHNPTAAVHLARRKDLARDRLTQAGVPVPRHWRLDLRRPLAAQTEDIRFPCVLKPVALAASRGVIRADNLDQLTQAAARIQVLLTRARLREAEERETILVEEFIPGFEVAVEGLLTQGNLEILTIFDKPDPLDGPYFEETYYITPSRLDAPTQKTLRETISAACAAYGLREGPIHAECRINDKGVWILEVAARTIGGLCGRLLRFGTGSSLEELVLLHALGEHPELNNETGGAGVLMIPTPQAGILRRVEGVLTAGKVPYIEEVVINVREGYELVPLPEGSSYLGFIFARAPSAEEAEAALRAAHACLRVVVMPLWKGVNV
ncbi:MAG: ATP-grasp domain-containing protein [Gammaproteobacteria bacterium]|nr:ATP-grasp domain-containing protein [Gammaproteobacteria bacterium]MDH3562176.1 ATP-grasp domain-containing protein [Gammaproteobacteria bacterium]MDH5487818.1 ATP-grasp domain-containing protein [Gammaproteobacteria bacterium]